MRNMTCRVRKASCKDHRFIDITYIVILNLITDEKSVMIEYDWIQIKYCDVKRTWKYTTKIQSFTVHVKKFN